jgi:hypothetical protein
MFRSPLAVIGGILCGWVAWGLLWAAYYAIGHRQAPEQFPWPLPPVGQPLPLTGLAWLTGTLCIDLVVALATGWIVARLAPHTVFNHACIAAVILTVGGLMTIAEGRAMLPAWIAWCSLVIMPAGVLAGAWLRGERADIPSAADGDEPEGS